MLKLEALASMSISKKLLLLLLIIFMPASGIIVASSFSQRAGAIREAENRAFLLVQSLAAQQEQLAFGARQMLSTLAQLSEVKHLNVAACNELFAELNKKHPFYSTISLITPEGTMLAASAPFEPGTVNLSDRKHFKDAVKTLDFSVGEYIVGRVSGIPSINFSYPVLDANKNLVAVVIAGLRLDEYAVFLTKMNLPADFACAISDHKGVRLFRFPEAASAAPGIPLSGEALRNMSGDRDQGLYEKTAQDGIYRFYAFKRLRLREDSPPYLYITVGNAKTQILQQANLEMLRNLSGLGLLCLFAMALVWISAKHFLVRPIGRLVATTRQFGKGEMGVRTHLPHTPDELGELAKSFDEMASLLEIRSDERMRAEAELQKAHVVLEEKVEERTAELKAVNDALRAEMLERNRAEEALRDSEKRFRSLFERSRAIMFLIDFESGQLMDVNKAAEEFYGYSRSEMCSMNIGEINQSPREEIAAAMQKIVEGKERCFVFPHKLRNSEIRTVEVHSSRIEMAGRTVLFSIVHDITERKRTENALAQMNEYLENVFENSPDGISIVDEHGKFIKWNKSASEQYGYTFEEMKGKSAFDLYADKDQLDRMLAELRREGTVKKYEVDMRRKDGAISAFEISISLLRDDADKVIGSVGVARDLSDMKKALNELAASNKRLNKEIDIRERAQDALKESERRLANIIDFLPDATFVIDNQGTVIFWNKAIEEMTGIKAYDMLGKSNYEYAIPFYGGRRPILIDLVLKPQKETEAKYLRVERNDTVLIGETYTPGLRHEKACLLGTASVLRDSNGNAIGAIESIRDITEARQAADDLRRTNVEMEQLLSSIPSFLIGLNPEHQITRWNRAAERLFGISVEKVLGMPIRECRIQWDRQKISEIISLCRENNASTGPDEISFLHLDGKEGFLRVTANSIESSGNGLPAMLLLGHDITERKKLEEERDRADAQLRQAQKLEALGTLAGGVAHDFNNILGIIMGFTELSKMMLEEGNPVGQNLQEVLNASKRAKDLVGQILAFSRRSEQRQMPLQLGIIVKEAMQILRPSLPSTIEIKTEVLSKSVVLADPTQMHQVLMNLCTNAAHAMQDKGGVLEVRLADIALGKEKVKHSVTMQPGRYVELTVKDTGRGIDPGIIDLIFDPFFTTKELGEGTGLGLSVVHGIVKSFGGSINVESSPGKGSTFTVIVPVLENGNEPKIEAIPSAVPRGNERVLVVDDEPQLVRMVESMLTKLGYHVASYTSGIEALEIARKKLAKEPFDLVVTDMTMPHLTGADLARELSKIQPDVPIILMSGLSSKVDADRAKEMGIKGFLMKPVTMEKLARTVRTVLDRKTK